MRTTISLDDYVLRAAKRLAARRGVTLSAVVGEALQAQLAAPTRRVTRPFKLVTFRGEGPRPGVDLDRTSELDVAEDVKRYGRARR